MFGQDQMLSLLTWLYGGGNPGAGNPPPLAGSPVPFGTPSAGMPTAGVPGSPMTPPIDTTTGMPTGAPTMPTPPPMPLGQGIPYGGQTQTINDMGSGQPAPGAPMPRPRPTNLGQALEPSPGYYGGSPETNPNLRPVNAVTGTQQQPTDLAKILGGIKMPQGPDVVKPSTPATPTVRPVPQSSLNSLLQSLIPGFGRGLRQPTTLGQALQLKPSAWGGIYG